MNIWRDREAEWRVFLKKCRMEKVDPFEVLLKKLLFEINFDPPQNKLQNNISSNSSSESSGDSTDRQMSSFLYFTSLKIT